MHLTHRHLLIKIVGGLWIAMTFWLILSSGAIYPRWAEWEVIGWFLAMFAVMFTVDRLYCAWLRRRIGVDPRKVHWIHLRNREGDFICAHCLSVFLLPPPDLDEAKMVTCGDCGAEKARYGEMKPHLEPERRYRDLADRVLTRFGLRL